MFDRFMPDNHSHRLSPSGRTSDGNSDRLRLASCPDLDVLSAL